MEAILNDILTHQNKEQLKQVSRDDPLGTRLLLDRPQELQRGLDLSFGIWQHEPEEFGLSE